MAARSSIGVEAAATGEELGGQFPVEEAPGIEVHGETIGVGATQDVKAVLNFPLVLGHVLLICDWRLAV